jgi:hypothetical protein
MAPSFRPISTLGLFKMAPELSQDLIQHLIDVGASERFADDELIPSCCPSARSGSFMRLAPQAWYEVADSLDDAQIVACIRTLTIIECLPNFSAGSVSPVIWLFHKLTERSRDNLTHVIDWVLSHTNNPYLPFGSDNLGAKSLAELSVLSARVAERAKARQADQVGHQIEAKERKATEATRRLFGALRRRDETAIVALLSRGADIYATNEQGLTALEYAQSVGLQQLLTPSLNETVAWDAPNATRSSSC